MVLRYIFIILSIICLQSCGFVASAGNCKGCLLLTPYINEGKNGTQLARQLSKVDPTLFYGLKSHAGFITVKPNYNSNLFFWFFPAEDMGKKPWFIWLNGGPGYSSLCGVFMSTGPFYYENGTMHLRKTTWLSDYSGLYLDNPVGAGFSFTGNSKGYTTNIADVSDQMYEFLQQFLAMFPELRAAPLFIAGESYAGKYVPGLAMEVHLRPQSHINLKGISIGNGLIDVASIMHYSDLCRVIGILGEGELKVLEKLERSVVDLIRQNKMLEASLRFNDTVEFIKRYSGVSVWDYRDSASHMSDFENLFHNNSIRKALHVGNAAYNLNNQVVYEYMLPDIAASVQPWFETLLDHYGVLCYSGQMDIVLSYSLSKHLYKVLEWSGRDAYRAAPRTSIRLGLHGDVVGYSKSGGNFTEVLIRNSGHLVPQDQPEVLKTVIDKFIQRYK